MGDSPKPPLEYDRTTTTVSVRGFRLLVLLTLVNTLLLVWLALAGSQGPQLVRGAWERWKANRIVRAREAALVAQQQQALTHALPPGTIVYTEDPARLASLGPDSRAIEVRRATVPDWIAPRALEPPTYWTALAEPGVVESGFSSVAGEHAIAFLGSRQTPAGERRLVVVRMVAAQEFRHDSGEAIVHTSRSLHGRAYAPFAPGSPAKSVARSDVELRVRGDARRLRGRPDGSYAVQPAPVLTVFAGQPDPGDPTHFTIPYEIDGQAGVIDGWLRDRDVLLKPRGGDATVRSHPDDLDSGRQPRHRRRRGTLMR